MVSTKRILRLIAAVLLLAVSVFLILKGVNTRYTVYGLPAEEDLRRTSTDSAEVISHFQLVEYASYDGITRLPRPDDVEIEETTALPKWVWVLKTRAAACES